MAVPYEKLTAPAEEIRILELDLGPRGTLIVCRTLAVRVAEKPSFTALSYCWGVEKLPYAQNISFNGFSSFGVTKNLLDALNHLRQENQPVRLWIDALCINQNDDEEKNAQIKLMGDIYSMAEETCIWLGEAADDSDKAMDAIAGLDGHNLNSPRNALDTVTIKAIKSLQQRPWWSRVWVIQETMLSPKPVIRCGDKFLLVDDFVRLDNIRRCWHAPSQAYVTGIETSISLASTALGNPFSDVLTWWDDARERVRAGKSTLAEWAWSLSDFQATNPKDKIYGLLALGSDADRRVMQVCYQKSIGVNVVYTRATAWFLISSRSLIHFQTDTDHRAKQLLVDGDVQHLPSWVLDFSLSSPQPDNPAWRRPLYASLTGSYRAYGDQRLLKESIQAPNPFPPGWLEKLAAPHLRGLVVDTVAYASGCPQIDLYRGEEPAGRLAYRLARLRASVDCVARWEAEAAAARPKSPYAEGLEQRDAFLLTVLGNRGQRWERLDAETIERWRGLMEVFLGRDRVPPDFGTPGKNPTADEADERMFQYAEAFIRPVISRTTGRNFVITTQGYFGLAPMSTEAGDMVCVLEGGDVPFVLRWVTEKDFKDLDDMNLTPSPDQVYCSLIGESYIHGVSDGEWISSQSEDEVKEFIIC